MNEQIRELAKQAGGHKCLCVDAMSISLLGENSIEKFAELLVRECMWKIMTRKEEAIDHDWDVDEAMSTAISDISKHFGVEQ
jgi:hypothetical protein